MHNNMRNLLFVTNLMLIALFVSCGPKDVKTIIADTKEASFIIYTYDEYGTPAGSGSGFFIDANGTGITNYHVLDGAVKAMITLSDSTELEIDKVIASDSKWDIIKFSIKNPNNKIMKYLKFANKQLEQGDKVYNISAPMGLEQTVSDGIISSLREDSHGQVVQITAPISPGSSGSAILNNNGDVIAVATFLHRGGQNLNFGVAIDDTKVAALTQNEFDKKNSNFNRKDDFIIMNVPNEKNSTVVLHALEFKKDATVAYLTYTNLDMAYENMAIWCQLNKKDDGFYIEDKEHNRKYYVTSSTIGADKANGTDVALASSIKFKIYFPAIKDVLHNIDICEGKEGKGWRFINIDLDKYREHFEYDPSEYIREYAYTSMHKGDLSGASSIFASMLEDDPEDVLALNAMGIISYVVDNNSDALYYFSKAIDSHPNNTIAYLNRGQLYKYQNDYEKAIADISSAINIDPATPDHFYIRGSMYMTKENWAKAIEDFSKAIEFDDYKSDPAIYYIRAIAYAQNNNLPAARNDVQTAYNLTNDPEMENALQKLWRALY